MPATLTQAEKKEAEVWTMPTVSVGQVILWHPDGDRNTKPWPCIVTDKGPRTINAMPVGRFEERLGVRHVDDPMAKDFELREAGSWEHTDETKEIWDKIIDL